MDNEIIVLILLIILLIMMSIKMYLGFNKGKYFKKLWFQVFIMKKFLEWFICDFLPGILDIIGVFLG